MPIQIFFTFLLCRIGTAFGSDLRNHRSTSGKIVWNWLFSNGKRDSNLLDYSNGCSQLLQLFFYKRRKWGIRSAIADVVFQIFATWNGYFYFSLDLSFKGFHSIRKIRLDIWLQSHTNMSQLDIAFFLVRVWYF